MPSASRTTHAHCSAHGLRQFLGCPESLFNYSFEFRIFLSSSEMGFPWEIGVLLAPVLYIYHFTLSYKFEHGVSGTCFDINGCFTKGLRS
jgi:hypothetical protein